jgi:hypothetical protein
MENITYKIRFFNEATGSIVVEFNDFPPFNIDLPLVDNKYPEGEALDEYVKGFLPLEFIQRKKIIEQGIENASNIAALVEPFPVPEPRDLPPVVAAPEEEQPVSQGTQTL